ncbi:MAG: beta-phosphoglucomutase family hydrolase [Planctomycetota bacterium]
MNEPDALIFDLDGTLADTMPVHFIVWQEVLSPHGLAFPEDRFYRCGGMPTWRIVEMLAAEQGKSVDVEQVVKAKYDGFFAHVDDVQPIDAVMAVALEHHGSMPLAVATGGKRAAADRTLAAIQATHLFDAVVTADDVAQHKPHPETFLRAAELLGVDPTRCRAYEDADPGIEAARAAGMAVVDVREMLADAR